MITALPTSTCRVLTLVVLACAAAASLGDRILLAQSPEVLVYRIPDSRIDQFNHIREVRCGPCGGFVLAGPAQSGQSHENSGYLVMEIAPGTHEPRWAKLYHTGTGVRSAWLVAMEHASDDGYVFSGTILELIDLPNPWYRASSQIIKINSAGGVEWAKTFSYPTLPNTSLVIRDIQAVSGGGYIVAGYLEFENFETWVRRYDGWLAKLDDAGNIEWQRRYSGDWDVTLKSVRATPDGNYVLAGRIRTQDLVGDYNNMDALVIKTRPSGVISWQRTFGVNGWDEATAIDARSSVSYLVGGTTPSSTGSPGSSSPWLFELDSSGSIQWEKVYGTSVGTVEELSRAGDGGSFFSASTIDQDRYLNILLVRTNVTGDVVWRREYGGTDHESPYASILSQEGNPIVLGETWSADHLGRRFDGDAWALFLDADGSAGISCAAAHAPDNAAAVPTSVTVSTSSLSSQASVSVAQSINVTVGDAVVEVVRQCPQPIRAFPVDRLDYDPRFPPFENPFDPRPGGGDRPPTVPPKPCPPFCPPLPLMPSATATAEQALLSGLHDALIPRAMTQRQRQQLNRRLQADVRRNAKLTPDLRDRWLRVLSTRAISTPYASDSRRRLSALLNETTVALLGYGPTSRITGKASGDRVDFDGLASIEIEMPVPPDTKPASLELISGIPAFADRHEPVWPLVTFAFTGLQKSKAQRQTRVSFYYGGFHVADPKTLRLLAWNGSHFVDVTTSLNEGNKTITGDMRHVSTLVLMSRRTAPVSQVGEPKRE